MLKKIPNRDVLPYTHPNSPIIIRKSSNSAAQKPNYFQPQCYPHPLVGFPIRSNPRNSSQSYRHQTPRSLREASIDQIKSKLKEYLRKTQENSLLNYQNQSLPQFNKKSIHENFRMTLFRNNLKKKINLKILQTPFAERYESSPQFNVSEAYINPRAQKRLDQTDKLFHPKREYFIHHHQKRKEKIPIPKFVPHKTVYPLTNRQSSFRQRQRGGLGVQPWRRWGRDSEQGDIVPQEDL